MARPSTCLQPLLGGGGARGRGRGLQVAQGVEAGGPGVEDISLYLYTCVPGGQGAGGGLLGVHRGGGGGALHTGPDTDFVTVDSAPHLTHMCSV